MLYKKYRSEGDAIDEATILPLLEFVSIFTFGVTSEFWKSFINIVKSTFLSSSLIFVNKACWAA